MEKYQVYCFKTNNCLGSTKEYNNEVAQYVLDIIIYIPIISERIAKNFLTYFG